MGESLVFTIDDNAIAELFGRQNFSTKESAILELVKNSYDAGAVICDIFISNNEIKIIDNGKGMTQSDINNKWMRIGRSDKLYKEGDRVLTGSKGVGRFAIARLGNYICVESKSERNVGVKWVTNWNENLLTENLSLEESGTRIIIKELRENWKPRDIKNLVEFLNRVYNDTKMKINVYFNDEKQENVSPIFDNALMGINYVSKIRLNFDSEKFVLYCNILSDEFQEDVQELVSVDIKNYNYEVDLLAEYENSIESSDISIDLFKELGDFSSELYFSLDRVPIDISEKFMYKHKNLFDRYNTGVILYRNSFSISSLEGKKDWLGLNKRSRKSPAAASHKTGSWRVRSNQLSGAVHIDKIKNKYLIDLSNRQGLDENDYYELFLEIIELGIKEFERYRQSIIRELSPKEEPKKIIVSTQKTDKFIKDPLKFFKNNEQEILMLSDELKKNNEKTKNKEKEYEENEKKFEYNTRVMNVLATQGLKGSSIAHELDNNRNVLDQGYSDVVESLQEYGMWEELNSKEKTQYIFRNVPATLKDLEDINILLKKFLDTMLGQLKKSNYEESIDSLSETMDELANQWMDSYNWIRINLKTSSLDKSIFEYKLSKDNIITIFDNLLLNSVQQNKDKNFLVINISYIIEGEKIKFKYSDNGVGLPKKFQKNPNKILEVHESSREKEGHGLGMWIVHNTIHMLSGSIDKIYNDNGFNIEFNMEGISLK